MSKNFTRTMSLDDFKTMQKETPKGIFDEFVTTAKRVEDKTKDFAIARNKLAEEFISRPDRLLFTYEHLPSFEDLKPSEMGELMRTADFWVITKVGGRNEVIISFFNNGKSTSTSPIPFDEFKEFLGIEE